MTQAGVPSRLSLHKGREAIVLIIINTESSSMKDKMEESLCFKWLEYGPASGQRDEPEDFPKDL